MDKIEDPQKATKTSPIRLIPKRPGPDLTTGTVEAALKFIQEFYDDVKAGKADVSDGFAIHYLSNTGGDTVRHHFWSWQLSTTEHVGMLTVGIHQVLEDARGN